VEGLRKNRRNLIEGSMFSGQDSKPKCAWYCLFDHVDRFDMLLRLWIPTFRALLIVP
jgi:hypothetical protein